MRHVIEYAVILAGFRLPFISAAEPPANWLDNYEVRPMTDFPDLFELLTGNKPFPWQCQLYRRFVDGDIPAAASIPTGLGKTAVIPTWLIALANKPAKVLRRLVYVVNRRTVVDQATGEAERLRERLVKIPDLANRLARLCATECDPPLAISTLRGQFADNAEWRRDPTRPAVIIGTVDMVGSRLLFSGYGCGFRTRPSHAGLLGQDTLLVHDEAHLEPAFQELLSRIEKEQDTRKDIRPLRVLELTATSRLDSGSDRFELSAEDLRQETVHKRVNARKGIHLHCLGEKDSLSEKVAALAVGRKDSGQAILIFLRTVKDVLKVAKLLKKQSVQVLTGTLRGLERDRLAATDPIFARFLPASNRSVDPLAGTVYLVCTSAGEVGVNISADHLVCDMTPFDSMAQRFGRVNRFGDGNARLDVVCPKYEDDDKITAYDQRCLATLALLEQLPRRPDNLLDASPAALNALPADQRQAAFSPTPSIPLATEILFDAWALTTVRGLMPGRPPVAEWLHGHRDWEPPEIQVAWRWEAQEITGDMLAEYPPEDLLEDYPLKPHELLRGPTEQVFKDLTQIAKNHADLPVWVIEPDGAIQTGRRLGEWIAAGKDAFSGRTVLLPPMAGGLKIERGQPVGLLDGASPYDETHRDLYDVADQWLDDQGRPRRMRVWDDQEVPAGFRLVRRIEFASAEEDGQVERVWRWYMQSRSAEDAGTSSGLVECELKQHLADARQIAEQLICKLHLPEWIGRAVVLAAAYHDLGKDRRVWQQGIGNWDTGKVLAKSGRPLAARALDGYRHEFGSLLDMAGMPELLSQPPEVRDLALHLVAAHHGRARPHFPMEEAFDREKPAKEVATAALEVSRRFGRLQRQLGRWGLAYLESLVRAVDALASERAGARGEQTQEATR